MVGVVQLLCDLPFYREVCIKNKAGNEKGNWGLSPCFNILKTPSQ